MGLLDGGLRGLADDLGKSSEATRAVTFEKPMKPETFDSFGGDVKAGKNVELARYRVPAGTEIRWGSGRAANPENQGYAWAQLKDDTSDANGGPQPVHGVFSYEWENATGRRTEVATEIDSRDIDTTDRYNRDQQKPMPEQRDKRRAQQDEYLVVTFTSETDATVVQANSECRFPATEYDVSA